MKVGLSYWGFLEKFEDCSEPNTPDGHRYGRPIFVDELHLRDHEVFSLQKMREKFPYNNVKYDSSGFPDIDLLFIEWRWPTYKNSGENPQEPDLIRQNELLSYYHGKIPIVVWDCDHKVTDDDERRWPHVRFADPSLRPKEMFATRDRLMFWTDWKAVMNPAQTSFEYGYIGNNYERDEQFGEYYGACASALRGVGIQTTVCGNWLQKSPEREDPSKLISRWRNVAFGQRMGFKESMQRLNSFIVTCHISKPDYSTRGFVSPRFLENIAFGTPAIVPAELMHRDFLGKEWIVFDSHDVVTKVSSIANMSYNERASLVQHQREVLQSKRLFSVVEAVEYIESLEK